MTNTHATLYYQRTLPEWLHHLEGLHPRSIDLGLERIKCVQEAMQLFPSFPVITVGGTNGKGSVVAMLTAILVAAGYKVGTYTSPHLQRYNERVAINQRPVSDERIVQSLAAVEAARAQQSLTYFEFATLAAMHTFIDEAIDVAVLEVGLGGRLDAVNVFEPDASIVVSVDLDHEAWLGNDREAIGFEKAGIFRADKPAICADPAPPERLVAYARTIGAHLLTINRDFSYQRDDKQWTFNGNARSRYALPLPALRGEHQLTNAAAALMALDTLAAQLPVHLGAIKQGLVTVDWPGRFQVLPGRPVVVLDVAHNPHAVHAMLANLNHLPFAAHRYAVFAMLADKAIETVLAAAKDAFDGWFIGGLDVPRGLTAEALAQRMKQAGVTNCFSFPTIQQAWQAALSAASENDRITVFGSFHTVAAVIDARYSD